MRPTITEVAKRSRVSTTTVSNFLNGNYANMSAKTRDRIAAVIEELNYIPRIVAQSLPKKRKARTIALVIPRSLVYIFRHSYFAEVSRGIARVLERYEYRSILISLEKRSDEDVTYLKSLSNGIVDGFLFFDIRPHERFLTMFRKAGIPAAGVGYDADALDVCVDDDVVSGARSAVEYLIGLGHTAIGLIPGPEDMVFSEQMRNGYRAALNACGIRFGRELTRYCAFQIEEAYHAVASLVSESPVMTAILAGSGEIARGCMRYVYESNGKVPDNLSLVNFGEKVHDGRIGGFVTHVRQQIEEIGARVTEKLFDQILGDSATLQFEQFPTELVIGNSCAGLNHGAKRVT